MGPGLFLDIKYSKLDSISSANKILACISPVPLHVGQASPVLISVSGLTR